MNLEFIDWHKFEFVSFAVIVNTVHSYRPRKAKSSLGIYLAYQYLASLFARKMLAALSGPCLVRKDNPRCLGSCKTARAHGQYDCFSAVA